MAPTMIGVLLRMELLVADDPLGLRGRRAADRRSRMSAKAGLCRRWGTSRRTPRRAASSDPGDATALPGRAQFALITWPSGSRGRSNRGHPERRAPARERRDVLHHPRLGRGHLRRHRRAPVVDRPRAARGVQHLRGVRDLGRRDRHADLRRVRPRRASATSCACSRSGSPASPGSRRTERGAAHEDPVAIAVLVVVAGLVAACSSGSEGSGGMLDGTDWVLRSYLRPFDAHPGPRDRVRGRRVQRQPGLRVRRLQPVQRARTGPPAGRCSSPSPRQHADGVRRAVDGLRDRVPVAARPEPLLQRPPDDAHDLRPGPGDPARVRRRPANPLLGRWDVDSSRTRRARSWPCCRAPRSTPCSASAASPALPAATRSAGPTERTGTSSGSASSPPRGSRAPTT